MSEFSLEDKKDIRLRGVWAADRTKGGVPPLGLVRHFVATAFVVKRFEDGKKTILLLHKKLGAWLPPGGHVEENELPQDAALREVREETGLDAQLVNANLKVFDELKKLDGERVVQLIAPYNLQLELIEENHYHIDFVYFAKALGEKTGEKNSESMQVKWFSQADLDEEKNLWEEVRLGAKKALQEVEC
ncbi:NUDIX domain-containing protein [Candidatus Micrarchaeota archaeon]|nr:NUDIX domain-containing protein [Candidatus Micrarchaeota archaeon]